MTSFAYLNVRAHWLDAIKDRRTAVTRIRNAVLNADVPRFNLWGI
jgi:hypothetical protein